MILSLTPTGFRDRASEVDAIMLVGIQEYLVLVVGCGSKFSIWMKFSMKRDEVFFSDINNLFCDCDYVFEYIVKGVFGLALRSTQTQIQWQ